MSIDPRVAPLLKLQEEVERRSNSSRTRITETKVGDPLLVYAEWQPQASGLAIDVVAHLYPEHPTARLSAEVREEVAEIIDIQSSRHGEGVGSALLKLAEETFRALGANRINGWLSPVDARMFDDPDRRERQIAFYKKNGYSVSVNGDEGTVRKKI